jgi:hypothetical protein
MKFFDKLIFLNSEQNIQICERIESGNPVADQRENGTNLAENN